MSAAILSMLPKRKGLHPEGFRCALWSNGALQLERGAATLALLSSDETRALVAYLERMAA